MGAGRVERQPATTDIASNNPEHTKPSVAKTTVNTSDKGGQEWTAGKVSSTPDEQMHYLVMAPALKTALGNQHSMSPAELSEVRETFENFQADADMKALLNRSPGELAKGILKEYDVFAEEYERAR